jgi:hypothetical protein
VKLSPEQSYVFFGSEYPGPRKTKFTPVESVLDINDDRLWYYIPSCNGYEVSNDNYIRSMKHYRSYPFGILISPKRDKKGNVLHPEDPSYELSNNNNERITLRLSQILDLAKSNPYHITGYPRRTCICDTNPRNQKYFIQKKLQAPEPTNNIKRYPKFTIVPETEVDGIIERRLPNIICPMEYINGGEYLGRKNN